jgi:hypothetical protein
MTAALEPGALYGCPVYLTISCHPDPRSRRWRWPVGSCHSNCHSRSAEALAAPLLTLPADGMSMAEEKKVGRGSEL